MVIRLFAAAIVLLLLPAQVARAELVTGERIRSALSGNTLEGTMDTSGQYIEYYDPAGIVRADEYGGKWTIVGDTLCWDDGSFKVCWNAEITGGSIKWLKHGKVVGTGTIILGNPYNF